MLGFPPYSALPSTREFAKNDGTEIWAYYLYTILCDEML